MTSKEKVIATERLRRDYCTLTIISMRGSTGCLSSYKAFTRARARDERKNFTHAFSFVINLKSILSGTWVSAGGKEFTMRHVRQFLYLMAICLPVMFITSCSDDDEEDYGTSTTQGQQGGESEPEPLDVPDIPSNEIWYTSTDGKVIQPINHNYFGATILSNIYSNGKGIITFDTDVTEFGSEAFRGYSGLTGISIPNSVTSIGHKALTECPNLNIIKVMSGNKVFDSRDNCNAIIETASNTLILGCKNTIIPNSVTSIGEGGFYHCYGLTSINIPNSVTSIGYDAFRYCPELTSVTISNSVLSIDKWAFSECRALTSIEIPNSVTSMEGGAFHGCSSLSSIKVADGNKVYDSRNNCNAIIETASNTLIRGCENTVIPNSVSSIEDYAFNSCSGLTSINIPNSVTSIGWGAFEGCHSLTSINIPNSVTSIGSNAFLNCSSLTSVYVNWDKPLSISSYTFYDGVNLSGCTLYVPKGTKSLYASAEVWKDFGNIVEQP